MFVCLQVHCIYLNIYKWQEHYIKEILDRNVLVIIIDPVYDLFRERNVLGIIMHPVHRLFRDRKSISSYYTPRSLFIMSHRC